MSVGALIEFYFKLIICITIPEEPFFFFLFFTALRRVDFFEKMALMLNFIKAMKELSVISWEGGVILWVVKLIKKLVSLLLE
ncbi:MAG: hypothetical protein ACK5UO_14655 [Microcystis sp.]|uniref:hypothetical protein n=1 Tax=Microcystis sp. TaxID=1127 RepID=UPI00391A14AE